MHLVNSVQVRGRIIYGDCDGHSNEKLSAIICGTKTFLGYKSVEKRRQDRRPSGLVEVDVPCCE